MQASALWSCALVAVVLAFVLACGGGGKDPAVCRREAAELSQLLSSMDHEVPAFYAPDVSLVTRADVPRTRLEHGPAVTIGRDGVAMDEVERMARGSTPRDVVYVVIDEAAPWEQVARTLVTLEGLGVTRPALAFARPPAPVQKPPRTKIDDDLDALIASDDASKKATELARMTEKVIKGCKPLQEAFGAVSNVEGESKAETLIRAIEPSLVACRCNLDVPAFRSIMFRLLYVEKPESSFRVTLDETGAAIALPPATPWREAHAHFSPDARVAIGAP